MDDSVSFKIREVVKADTLPVSPNAIVSLNHLSSLPHLQDVTIPKINQDKVSLLIGFDCPNAHRILEMREGNGTQPNAFKTSFGWSLLGPAINRTEDNQDMQTYFVQSDEALDHEIRKSWFTEFESEVIKSTEATGLSKGPYPDEFHFVENKQVAVSRVQEIRRTVDDMIVSFSSLFRLKVACAWLRRFIEFLKDKSCVQRWHNRRRIGSRRIASCGVCERQVFAPVFKISESEVRPPNKVIKMKVSISCLYKISPILFEGFLRVGRRLESATIDFSPKHPAILPCQHHLQTC